MIVDINGKSERKELEKRKLPEYWGQYFIYEKDFNLSILTETELLKGIELAKKMPKPYIDSQVLISTVLTTLGSKHNFHRQFNEKHSELHEEQVLGMQLYKIIIEDSEPWIYSYVKHTEHKFSHSSYFISN